LGYTLKRKLTNQENPLTLNNFIQEDCHFLLILNRFTGAAVRDGQLLFLIFISLFIKLPVHCENLF
ncbi:hypothetical protein AAA232_20170, partial [Phocaeicola vulgatus]|uniref:hypothetical protein n=1 Tax=Phocaeicola vulgatus TaxID=821 RepID=UPI0032C0584C